MKIKVLKGFEFASYVAGFSMMSENVSAMHILIRP